MGVLLMYLCIYVHRETSYSMAMQASARFQYRYQIIL